MSLFAKAYTYAVSHGEQLSVALAEHLHLVFIPLGLGVLIGLPLGVVCAKWSLQSSWRSQLTANVVLNTVNGLRVIPSLAILFLAIPYFGLSFQSAAIALTILALPPILLATEVGFRTLDPAIRETAVAMGMTHWQRFHRVELPLALPVVLAGIKTATIEVIASATLAAFIGAGGLGAFITLGFALYDHAILLVGAIPVAILALIAEVLLSTLQEAVSPPIH